MIRARTRAERELKHKLGEIFKMLDMQGQGEITYDRFLEVLGQESAKVWMSALDIDANDPKGLFELLDLDGDGGISPDEFILGAPKVRGTARSIDLFHLQTSVERMEAKIVTVLPEDLRGPKYPGE